MIYLLGGLVVAYIAWTALVRGSGAALARGWALAIVAPCWISMQVASAEIDLRLIAAGTALVAMAIAHDWKFPTRLCWSDVAAAALVAVQLGSEYQNGAFGLKALFQIGSQWALPYLLGRLMFRGPSELVRMQPIACTLCLALSVWVISESVLGVNLVNRGLNHSGSHQSETDRRWGLRRAEGPTSHPIFCGLLLVSLFPWSLQGSQMSRQGYGPSWWRIVPWIHAAAIFGTMSRGPQAALLVTLGIVAFVRWPRYRVPILTAVGAVALTAMMARGMVVDVLHSWSKEAPTPLSHITVAGKDYEYSGTTHRMLQFLVYRDAMAKAGMLGYGVESLSATPLKLPNVEPHLLISPFDSIDNHYIYFTLCAGHLAVASFIALGLLSVVSAWRSRGSFHERGSTLAIGLLGSQIAVMAALLSVWFADDFGFQWLFNAGYLASWQAYSVGQQREATQPSRSLAMRLVPGHPVSPSHFVDKQLAPIG